MARERDHSDRSDQSERRHTLAVPRSRGAVTGVLLIALGAWGVLLPMIGPHFHFGYGPDNGTFDLTQARLFLQVLPGIVAFAAGVMLLLGGNRVTGTFWAFAACAAGAWFVVGPTLADLRSRGYVGAALGSSDRQHLDVIAAFTGLGAVILFLGALAAGRLAVVGVRDVETSQKRHAHDDGTGPAADDVAAPAYPATREVPVTTTQVPPAEAPAVVVLPDAEPAAVDATPEAVPTATTGSDVRGR